MKSLTRMTLHRKLMITFLIVMLIPAVIVGTLSYHSSSRNFEQQLLDNARINVDTANKIVSQQIGSKIADIDQYARLIDSEDAANPEASGLRDKLKLYLATHEEVQNIFLGTENKTMVRAREDVSNDDYDPRERPWYQQAVAQPGQTVISAVTIDSKNNPVIFISRTTADGRGVLSLSLNLTKLHEMTDIQVGKHGYVFIMDQSKHYVAHPTEELGKAISTDYVEKLFAADKGTFLYQYDGQTKQMIFSTNELTGWKVAGSMMNTEISDAVKPIRNTTLIVIIASILVIGVLATLLIHSLLRPLKRLQRNTEQISEGDLTLQVATAGNDEIGELSRHFQQMVDNLRSMISQVQEMTENLSSSSQQLAAGAEQTTSAIEHVTIAMQEVAVGTEKQLVTIREGDQRMQEMSAEVDHISASMQQMSDIAAASITLADSGSEAIGEAVVKMDSIQTTVSELDSVIEDLNTRSSHIGSIVGTISEIAKQTNLLSLNASIEAARAGEHGRGFSVVATEVRKLAELSAQSAQQITDLIHDIQNGVATATARMDAAKARVGEGITAVDISGRSFSRIRRSIGKSAQQIDSIAVAAAELARNSANVVDAMEEVGRLSQETAGNSETVSAAAQQQLASMEEIGSSAADLTRMAEQLQLLVARFKLHASNGEAGQ
ncbi:methyl-accepting chemotaxis protein [Paenibacillus sp. P96]|uniref:Methyl-accepting chemotaxis protein n=1 Tax=Paenibacillus zeirhizosphaerae TaxID=2987519 RepID=A0ABT9FSD8_9BACL|nr:methyl-accepting chemotaxis protein [Paenibacillus sp. P96]MDP4097642.1 methyl-accepting chemotaxis protein [Paenibacillus sp. P96]